jgi:CYTH domain-containing protein
MKARVPSLAENKYARPEYERRFLLKTLPEGLDDSKYARIVDHYVKETRLRLRRVERPSAGIVEYKLGLKFGDSSLPAGCVALTNLYLTEAEYDYLRPFVRADSIVKRRYPYVHNGGRYGIDVFEGTQQGLILAEIELNTADEFLSCPTPEFAVCDVTVDSFFTGGNLAAAPRSLITAKLAEFLN